MVKKLLHTRYRVNDLEKTIHFYTQVLGLKEVRRICSYPASGPVTFCSDLTHLAFEVESIEAFAKHSAALGYPLSDGPTPSSSGVFAFIDAPEGYEIELIEYRK